MVCEKCGKEEGQTYAFFHDVREKNEVKRRCGGRVVLCDQCISHQRSKLQMKSRWALIVAIAGLSILFFILRDIGPTFSIAGLDLTTSYLVFMGLSMVSFILLDYAGKHWWCLIGNAQARFGANLAENVYKGKARKGTTGLKPNERNVNDFYEALKSNNVNQRCNAARDYLKINKTRSLKDFFELMQSEEFTEADTALWILEIEIDKPEYGIDPTELEKWYRESMPFFAKKISGYTLCPAIQYLDTNMVRMLHILAKHGDASVIKALSSLARKIYNQRQKDGYLRKYIQTGTYGGWMDNDGWDKVVKETVDAITQRYGLPSVALPSRVSTPATETAKTALEGKPAGASAEHLPDKSGSNEPAHSAVVKYCTYRKCNVEIHLVAGQLTCVKGLPVTDACQQNRCRYHNAMGMGFFLKRSMLPAHVSDEQILASLGAKDFCK
jgi:hypothetical protein